MKLTKLDKSKHSIEYLGCDVEYFKNFIQSKMSIDMNWSNIHFDHIKPIDSFDLDNYDEFLACSHYTNFQPLLVEDNLKKNNKWSEEAETFWRENIKGKEYLQLYIPK